VATLAQFRAQANISCLAASLINSGSATCESLVRSCYTGAGSQLAGSGHRQSERITVCIPPCWYTLEWPLASCAV